MLHVVQEVLKSLLHAGAQGAQAQQGAAGQEVEKWEQVKEHLICSPLASLNCKGPRHMQHIAGQTPSISRRLQLCMILPRLNTCDCIGTHTCCLFVDSAAQCTVCHSPGQGPAYCGLRHATACPLGSALLSSDFVADSYQTNVHDNQLPGIMPNAVDAARLLRLTIC